MQSTYQSSLRCVCIYYIYLFSLPPKASAFKTSEVRLYLSFFLLPVVKVLKKGRERSKEKKVKEKEVAHLTLEKDESVKEAEKQVKKNTGDRRNKMGGKKKKRREKNFVYLTKQTNKQKQWDETSIVRDGAGTFFFISVLFSFLPFHCQLKQIARRRVNNVRNICIYVNKKDYIYIYNLNWLAFFLRFAFCQSQLES